MPECVLFVGHSEFGYFLGHQNGEKNERWINERVGAVGKSNVWLLNTQLQRPENYRKWKWTKKYNAWSCRTFHHSSKCSILCKNLKVRKKEEAVGACFFDHPLYWPTNWQKLKWSKKRNRHSEERNHFIWIWIACNIMQKTLNGV